MPHLWVQHEKGEKTIWRCERCSAEGRNTSSMMFRFITEKPEDDAKIWCGGSVNLTCEELQVAQIHYD